MHPVEVTLRNWRWAKPLPAPATRSNALC
jgi:hypothetical protein